MNEYFASPTEGKAVVAVEPQPDATPAQDAPLTDATFQDVVPQSAPRPEGPARLRGRTVAAIAVGSLALGALGGAATYFAIDANQDQAVNQPVTLPAVDPAGGEVLPASNEISAVVAAAMPSVVQVEVSSNGEPVSTGSGLVIREDGYILTNNHVVDAENAEVQVLFSDGSKEDAEIVGTTADYDLAVLKVDRDGLTPLVLGDSDAVQVGDPVIAIGSPLGLDSTVTTGIISALHRPVTTGGAGTPAFIDALQTDAAINPGNSGGPLLNAAGEVIGINSAVAAMPGANSQTGAGSVGLGFAIPSNQARHTAEQLIEDGVATYPVIGAVIDGTYTGEGVRVSDEGAEPGQPGVVPGGPADRAGIREGDIITKLDGRPVTNGDSLVVGIRAKAPGDTVTFTVERGGEEFEVSVTLTSSDEVDFGAGVAPREGRGSE